MSVEHLTEVVRAYSNGSDELDNRQYAKMLKEAGVVDKALSATDADLIFTKVKAKGERKIGLDALVLALETIAAKKKQDLDEVVDALRLPKYLAAAKPAAARGPERFHDPSTFTGTHARGGPATKGGSSGYTDLSSLIHSEHTQDDALHRSYGERSTGAGSESLSEHSRSLAGRGDATRSQAPLAGKSGVTSKPAGVRGPERFFYDKSSYTGTHTRGGPSTKGGAVGVNGYSDLSSLTNRGTVQNDALHRRSGAV